MGLWPTLGNENQRRHRESGDPIWVGRKMDSRFRGNDVTLDRGGSRAAPTSPIRGNGLIFRRTPGDEESRSALEDIQSEIPRGVYPEYPERDSFSSFRTGSSRSLP